MPNKRTDELPLCAQAQPDFYVPLWNTETNRTERLRLEPLLVSGGSTQNFEWVPDKDPAYQEDESVTYGGNWYQSLVDDNTFVPGTDDTKWLPVTKASSGTFWQAGLYTEDEVFVYNIVGDTVFSFRLAAAARPFASSNFENELQAGDWEQLGKVQNIEVDTTLVSDIITVDFLSLQEINFVGSDQITEAKTWAFDNIVEGLFSIIRFNITDSVIQTFPAGVKVANTSNSVYNSTTKQWTALATGEYEATVTYINGQVYMIINGPYE